MGAADQAVFLQHLQIPANRFGGDIESVSQLGYLDVAGAAGMIQDQSPAFVACPGLHVTRPLADVGALMMKGVLYTGLVRSTIRKGADPDLLALSWLKGFGWS
jgi:hypothetical protein